MQPHILLVDDEPAVRFAYSRYLAKAGYAVAEATLLAEAREILASRRFDAIIIDMLLPDGNGIEWISDIRKLHQDIAIVVITGMGAIPLAVEAIHRGADNFLTKPVSLPDLDIFLRKSLELGTLRRKRLTDERLASKFQPCFGISGAMNKVLELASVAAGNQTPVLLQGETGAGKGVLARWIFENARQSSGAFVEVNCSSLRGDLLASELFGHTKGAFTSAVQDKQGLIEVADGGTLFLDEIADMDPGVQAQFLKVIEEKQYRRLGDVRMRTSDFRLISATNRDLAEETAAGRFRNDLFYRINVFPIRIPPLRERPEDVPELVRTFLSIFRAPFPDIPQSVMDLLTAYPWPGNVRELRNVLERALLIAQGSPLSPSHFPGLESAPARQSGGRQTLARLEASHIQSLLAQHGGDVRKVAEALGMSRATLYRKLKKIRDH